MNSQDGLLDKVSGAEGHVLSVEEWEIELARVLAGERDSFLRRTGAPAYVHRIVSLSRDSRLAQSSLDKALRNAVSRWQPSRIESPYALFVLLELIGAYQPDEGFMKIVELIRQGPHLPVIPPTEGGYSAGQDLHMKALVDLEYFYPSAHPNWERDFAFSSYLDVLNYHLQDEAFCSYAIARLIDLKVIEIKDVRVRSAIEMNLRAINQIVALLLVRSRLAGMERELSEIYSHCFILGSKALEHFENVLRGFAVDVKRERDGVQLEVELPGKQGTIKVDVSEHFIVELLELGNQRGLEEARALAAKR